MDAAWLMMYAGSIVRIGLLIIVGIPLVRWCSQVVSAWALKHFSPHSAAIIKHIIFYGGLTFILVTLLHECGFNVVALLGAAGIVGVALGFASQTSVSNVISGFFLLLEHSFSVGDIIKSGDVMGYVESIGLLSISIRTLDNKMVRLPNELVLKQQISNITYYPIKRIDCVMSLPYATDVEYAKKLIQDVVTNNTLFLQDPSIVVMVNKVAQHDFDTQIRLFLTVRVWVPKAVFTSAPAVLMQQLKEQFDKYGVNITIIHVN
jgi:small-conductance mechanosensitive channel